MNTFRRMEVLAKEIREELDDEACELSGRDAATMLAALVPFYPDNKRLFYSLVQQVMCAMDFYVEDLQAEEGRKILEQLAKGIEPLPNVRGIAPNPYTNIYRAWLQFEKKCVNPQTSPGTRQSARGIFYSGAASLFRLITDHLPELTEQTGIEFLGCLETELDRFTNS
jgi:hypothetical protein